LKLSSVRFIHSDYQNYFIPCTLKALTFQIRYAYSYGYVDNVKIILDTSDEEHRGTSYIRWGRKTCEGNATLVYKGILCK